MNRESNAARKTPELPSQEAPTPELTVGATANAEVPSTADATGTVIPPASGAATDTFGAGLDADAAAKAAKAKEEFDAMVKDATDSKTLSFKLIATHALSAQGRDEFYAGAEPRSANPVCYFLTSHLGYLNAGLDWVPNPESTEGKQMQVAVAIKKDTTSETFKLDRDLFDFVNLYTREKKFKRGMRQNITKTHIAGIVKGQLSRIQQRAAR